MPRKNKFSTMEEVNASSFEPLPVVVPPEREVIIEKWSAAVVHWECPMCDFKNSVLEDISQCPKCERPVTQPKDVE